MASLVKRARRNKRKGFNYSIQFDWGGTRRTVGLGSMPKAAADEFRRRIEYLLGALNTNTAPDSGTAQWLAKMDDREHNKLAAIGLVEPREKPDESSPLTLEAFIDDYLAKRVDIKDGTRVNMGHTRRNLLEFFEAKNQIDKITPGHADEFRLYLVGLGLADNTVRKRCSNAKLFFRSAVRKGLIAANPFDDLPTSVQPGEGPRSLHIAGSGPPGPRSLPGRPVAAVVRSEPLWRPTLPFRAPGVTLV